jgi:hypothetical protein
MVVWTLLTYPCLCSLLLGGSHAAQKPKRRIPVNRDHDRVSVA